MENKLTGIIFIILGLKVLLVQDFSGAWSDFHFGSNYLYIPLSILLFYVGYKFYTLKEKKMIEHSKCPKCKTSYNYQYLKDGLCPKCNIKTIEIGEYFKKYPDELEDV